jgi:hypothetical protein
MVCGGRSKRLARLTRILAGTFEEYGHPVETSKLLDENMSSIVATHYRLEATIIRGVSQPRASSGPAASQGDGEFWRVEIELIPVDPMTDDGDISELLLAVMLYRLTMICEAQTVEWLAPEASMSAEQFLDAFHSIGPATEEARKIDQVRRNSRFAAVEEEVHDISDRAPPVSDIRPGVPWITRDLEIGELVESQREAAAPAEQPNDIQRLTVWAMTGTVAFMSAPVAVSMAAVNLLRGEDFRLSTHVLALTGFLVMLHSTGALDKAVSKLPL